MNALNKSSVKAMAVLSAIAALAIGNAHVATISIGNVLASSPNRYMDFDGVAATNDLGSEFAASGLSFSRFGESGVNLISNTLCSNTQYGVSGNYLGLGLNHPCAGDVFSTTGVDFLFSADVHELSWTGYSRIIGGNFTMQLYHDANLVGSFVFNHDNQFDNESVLIKDVTFNRMSFSEMPGSDATMILDHLTWRGDVTGRVPLPGSLPLLGIGLIALGAMGKRGWKTKRNVR